MQKILIIIYHLCNWVFFHLQISYSQRTQNSTLKKFHFINFKSHAEQFIAGILCALILKFLFYNESFIFSRENIKH